MKRKIVFVLMSILLVGGVTGCGKSNDNNKVSDGRITITCTSKKDKMNGMETQNVTVYHFDDSRNATDYSVTTTQKFSDKSVYKEYKTAQEENLNDNSDKDITYDLKSDDKKLSLVFTMTVKNIDVNDAETEEEKDSINASSILKTNEGYGNTCKVEGIDKGKIK